MKDTMKLVKLVKFGLLIKVVAEKLKMKQNPIR